MEHWWNDTDRGKPTRGEKSDPVSIVHQKSLHRLTWDRTRASAVRGQQLTAWVMVRPQRSHCYNYIILNIQSVPRS